MTWDIELASCFAMCGIAVEEISFNYASVKVVQDGFVRKNL